MRTKREHPQPQLRLLPPLETLIPEDYYLRRLNRVLDLSFVHAAVADRYSECGRPSVDPEVIIRLFLLQAIDGISSVRALMQRVQVDLAYRWFIGYEIDEALPDHSTLSKALDRFGDAVFNELFARSIAQCRASGLVSGKLLHVDATTIRADVDAATVGHVNCADADARFGKFPGRRTAPGYKQHTVVDDRSRVIVGLTVTPANRSEHDEALTVLDQAVAHAGQTPEAVCGDAAYASGEHRAACEQRGIRLVSPPPQVPKRALFTVDDFAYDDSLDVFICPNGKRLSYIGGVSARPKQRRYAAARSTCRRCPLKERCTTSARRQLKMGSSPAALQRLRADSQTAEFKALYRRRAPVIEGIFAEAKQWHGLRRAWRRGLRKMKIQCWLVSAVLNFRRLMALVPHLGLSPAVPSLLNALRSIAGALRRLPLMERPIIAPQWIWR